MNPRSRVKTDLLAWRPVRAVALWPGFPLLLQGIGLVSIGYLVWIGLGIGLGRPTTELMTLRKTNLTTLTVWGLWWPAMIAIALAFGRIWCTVCPLELASRIGNALGRALGWPRLRLGAWLRAGWLIVVGYVVIQLLVAGAALHRIPHATAIFLLVIVSGALATGLLFRAPRAFCKAFCPAGALLSVYGRHTPMQLEMRDPAVCAACTTRECIRPELRHRLDARSCPSLIRPFDRRPSDGCVLCLQCVKVCPRDNVGFGLVEPAAPIRRHELLQPHEAVFVMVALGFVAHEVIGEVKGLDAFFHIVPARLAALLPSAPFPWMEALWFLVLFPTAVWGLIALLGYALGHRGSPGELLLAAATGAGPVIAMAHLAKALAKLSAWAGYLPLSLRDPRGTDTLARIADHSLTAPGTFVGLSILGWGLTVLTLVVAWRSWRWLHELSAARAGAVAGLAGSTLLFTFTLVVWGWQVP